MIVWPRESRTRFEKAERLRAVKQVLWYWLPPLAWMGLIFFLSSRSTLPVLPDNGTKWYDSLDRVIKKTGHMVVYGVLAWFYLRALRQRFDRLVVLRLASVVLAVAYGVSDEYHQVFVSERDGKVFDVAVDTVGACGAMLLDWWLECRRRLRSAASQAAEGLPTESRPTPAR